MRTSFNSSVHFSANPLFTYNHTFCDLFQIYSRMYSSEIGQYILRTFLRETFQYKTIFVRRKEIYILNGDSVIWIWLILNGNFLESWSPKIPPFFMKEAFWPQNPTRPIYANFDILNRGLFLFSQTPFEKSFSHHHPNLIDGCSSWNRQWGRIGGWTLTQKTVSMGLEEEKNNALCGENLTQ